MNATHATAGMTRPPGRSSVDREALDGEALDGEVLDGEVLDGEVLDGEVLDGEVLDGEALDRRSVRAGDPRSAHADSPDRGPVHRGTPDGGGSDKPAPTYYFDRDIHVTQRHLYVRGARFGIAELRDVGVDRGACPIVGVFTAVVAGTSAVVLIAGLASGALMVAMAAAIAVIVATPTAALIWHGRPHELWATYRGLDVRLFQCADPVRFGKVMRAIVRARRYRG